MSNPIALVVDDEPDIRELLALTLSRMNIQAKLAADLASARAMLDNTSFDLCLTDMRLPDGNGIELVTYIQQHYPNTPVAVITAHGNMESAVTALKAGAFDFVSKPVDLQGLRALVNSALKLGKNKTTKDTRQSELLGTSKAIQATHQRIAKLARSQAPVHISGESGTGKELVARLIHQQGPRADKPFIAVNCGAIPEALMESELFGHKKGSFTGATADKDGLFQAATGGTLFLDEVADLPLPMQVKLLRAIQEKAVRPVGAQQEEYIDVRILSATHKDLTALVETGGFRKDLYYRINVIELHAPSLRERTEDILLLAEHILKKLATQASCPIPELSSNARTALEGYLFPGNVRELENILERAMTLCEHEHIDTQDLQLPDNTGLADDAPSNPPDKKTIQQALEKTRYNKTAAAKLLGISFGTLRYRLKKLGFDNSEEQTQLSLDPQLDSLSRDTIQQAMEKTRFNKTAAAKLLGISLSALRCRLEKLDME